MKKKTLIRKSKGFTIIELLIVVAIIGILAVIAVPAYLAYTIKANFGEVVQATAPFKLSVESCYQAQGAIDNCTNGSNGIPPAPGASGNVASVVTAAGVITATATAGKAGGYTYVITPTPTNNVLIWAKGGTCVAAGAC